MFNIKMLIIIFAGYSVLCFAQQLNESKIDSAYLNAKKGIYWCLSNLPDKKASTENDLIINDKQIASVKLEKQVNGIKIISTGFFESYEVQIKLFKSNEILLKEGFIKPDSLKQTDVEKGKPIRKKKK